MKTTLHSLFVASVNLGIGFLSQPAEASLFETVGANCTDSNHTYVYYPDYVNPDGTFGKEGAGPKVCSNQAKIQVEMQNGYVPGEVFTWDWINSNAPSPFKRFSFDDGAYKLDWRVGEYATGWFPDKLAPSDFTVGGNAYTLVVRSNGTWSFGVDGGHPGPCYLGSVEGPGGCFGMSTWGYGSVGTYTGWKEVPEPETPILVLSSLGLLGFLKRRRKDRPTAQRLPSEPGTLSSAA